MKTTNFILLFMSLYLLASCIVPERTKDEELSLQRKEYKENNLRIDG